MPKPAAHAWSFRSKFRRSAFGWRGSRTAIERVTEALAEIRDVGLVDPALAGEGAVLLPEKVLPALCDVDSSSGCTGQCHARCRGEPGACRRFGAGARVRSSEGSSASSMPTMTTTRRTSSPLGTTGGPSAQRHNWPAAGQMNCCLWFAASWPSAAAASLPHQVLDSLLKRLVQGGTIR